MDKETKTLEKHSKCQDQVDKETKHTKKRTILNAKVKVDKETKTPKMYHKCQDQVHKETKT